MRAKCQIDCDTTDHSTDAPLEFKRLTLGDIDELRPYFRSNLRRICDSTIGGTFMWRDHMKTEFAVENEVLYLRAEHSPGRHSFAPPRSLGAPAAKLLERLEEHCRQTGEPLRFFPVSGSFHEELCARYPELHERSDTAWSDYLYNAEDLVTLAGRRFSGQRNHINKFTSLYPDWRFEAITADNLPAVRAFFTEYMQTHAKDSPAYTEGHIKALEVIDNLDLYRQLGGVLYAEDKVVAFAFGEIAGDTLFVHTEKALTEYRGSYPMIVNQFAKMYATEEIRYINREEDDGDEGLRKSKQSYHPIALLDKYFVEI